MLNYCYANTMEEKLYKYISLASHVNEDTYTLILINSVNDGNIYSQFLLFCRRILETLNH